MKPLNILVVEDDALVGHLLSEVLDALGHVVCGIATTEPHAVRLADQFHPDLLIVDLNLRDGSGVSAVAQIERTRPCPHVFISGMEAPPLLPGTVVLQKPFREDDLVRAIGVALAPAESPRAH